MRRRGPDGQVVSFIFSQASCPRDIQNNALPQALEGGYRSHGQQAKTET